MTTALSARAREARQQAREVIDPQSLLRLPQVLELIPISASSWWNGVRSGKFPRAIKLGPRTTAWRASDVLMVIERATLGDLAEQRTTARSNRQ